MNREGAGGKAARVVADATVPTAADPARPRKPIGLVLLHCLLAFTLVVGTIVFVGLLVGVVADVPGVTYTVDGQPVAAEEFRAVGARFYLGLPAFLVLVGAAAFALWRDRPWSRHALLALWVLTFVAPGLRELASTRDPEVLAVLLPWTAVVLWYLFRKRSIVAYYRAVAAGDVAITT